MDGSEKKWKVLISAPYMLPDLGQYKERLESHNIEIIVADVNERMSEEELLSVISPVDGVICGDDRFTRKVLEAAPKLKVISKWGTGIDSIDSTAASEMGIKVCNTPGAFTDPVADTVMGYILLFARGLAWLDKEMKAGKWQKYRGISLKECSLGIVGLGDVGKAIVKRAAGFGMEILATDVVNVALDDLPEETVRLVSLEELLKKSDFVTLNCTLNETSFHMMSYVEFKKMKSSAFLINTCRGPVVHELALIEALETQAIAGAALDVFEDEPLPLNSPLLTMSNCFIAPHNANSSPTAWGMVHENTINNLILGLREGNRN